VYLACGVTDMRKGVAGLAALMLDVLQQKPTNGAVFAFCGAGVTVSSTCSGMVRAFAIIIKCWNAAVFLGRLRQRAQRG
jgi:hypothetical protein